jgi:hypothetical protein
VLLQRLFLSIAFFISKNVVLKNQFFLCWPEKGEEKTGSFAGLLVGRKVAGLRPANVPGCGEEY